MSQIDEAWYGDKGLLLWFKKWINVYAERIVDAYKLINLELIPRRQYDRALVWCLYTFDVTILTHQMVSMVHENGDQTVQSVYFMDTGGLIEILKRLENQMNQCRALFDELLTLSAIERLYVALATNENGVSKHTARQSDEAPLDDGDTQMATTVDRFERELEMLLKRDSIVNLGLSGGQLPTGMFPYKPDPEQAQLLSYVLESSENPYADQSLTEIAASLDILRASSDRDAVRAENLEERLPPNNVRVISMIIAPGDAALARQIVESYLAKLTETIDGVRVYRIDYGDMLSKWRGESEKNFEQIMRWMVDRARENAIDGRHFDVLWIDSVQALMSQRGGDSAGEEYLNVIKTTMLQIMDVFNKDKTLSRFALLFSTGAQQVDIDAAFRRRIDSVYTLKGLHESTAAREILIKHLLYMTKVNVEGSALARLNSATNMADLQRLVYTYYVHSRFVIGTEFHVAARGTKHYTLQVLKPYFNFNGDIVRTGNSVDRIVQAVETGDGPRFFYRPGEVDGRNLSKENANFTVYVIYSDPTDGVPDH